MYDRFDGKRHYFWQSGLSVYEIYIGFISNELSTKAAESLVKRFRDVHSLDGRIIKIIQGRATHRPLSWHLDISVY